MELRITKTFHRVWLVTWLLCLAVLALLSPMTYTWTLEDHPTYDLAYDECIAGGKDFSGSGNCVEFATETEALHQGERLEDHCIKEARESFLRDHPDVRLQDITKPDLAQLELSAAVCQRRSGLVNMESRGRDRKPTVLVLAFLFVFAPYLLVFIVNWADGLVAERPRNSIADEIRSIFEKRP